MQTRRNCAKQERRNSVSETVEFFQAKLDVKMPNSPRQPRKASGRTKDKEKEKELREVRENIKHYIQYETFSKESKDNANGGAEAISHDNTQSQENVQEQLELVSTATQTCDDEMLKAIKELAIKYQKLEDTIEDPKGGISVNLAKVQEKVNNLHTDIHGAVSGLAVQIKKLTTTANENSTKIIRMENSQSRMAALLDENKRLVHELQIMQGLVQKVQQQASQNSTQVLELTKRGMEQNLMLHGVDDSIEKEDSNDEVFTNRERCKHSALKFFKEVMNLNLTIEDIWKAHRVGSYKAGKVKPLIVKLAYNAKELVMENLSTLKNKSNPITKQVYFINEQIPEGISETRKQASNRAKILKEANDKKPKEERSNIFVINDKVLVDGQVKEPEIIPPQPSQLFLDKDSQNRVDILQSKFVETDLEILRNSEFRALAVKVHSIQETQDAYIAAAQRYPAVDHIMMGYAFRDKAVKSGFCDDREYGAGTRIRKTIFETKTRNTAVFVLRKYGGVHLGFNRFQIIENMARKAIELLEESC